MKKGGFLMTGQLNLWVFLIFCALGSWAGWLNEIAASHESRRISALSLFGLISATNLFAVVFFQMKRIQTLETSLAELTKKAG